VRLDLQDIPRKGRSLTLEGESVRALACEALEADISEARGALTVRRRGDGAVVQGHVTARGTRACDRCGREAELAIEAEERLVFVPRQTLTPTQGEVELSERDLDVGFFDGSSLDTDDLLSELFALAAPFRVTCARLDCDEAPALIAGEDDDGSSGEGRPNPFAAIKDHF